MIEVGKETWTEQEFKEDVEHCRFCKPYAYFEEYEEGLYGIGLCSMHEAVNAKHFINIVQKL